MIVGYFTYGKFTERFFGISSERATPVCRLADGVDYQRLKPWKIYVIQFLNIAGLGPIFGAVLGAAYGPVAYLWIVFGCIFMGAVHDYFSGMLSLRNDGMSLPDIIGKYLGKNIRKLMVVFTAFLLIAVGVSFVNGPSVLLASLTGWDMRIWLYVIFLYYIIATLLPVDKIIGKIYPVMGAALIFMAGGILVTMLYQAVAGDIAMTELTGETLGNLHAQADSNYLFPTMFVIISCGAISGFHATQSPMMARCMTDEKYGRPCFYGAMITEGIVAMIWAAAAMAYCGGPEGLNAAGKEPAVLVEEVCKSWLGITGAVIAIIGVVICPITTGDTAFRSMRLIIADALKYTQKPVKNRLLVTVPIFVLAYFLCRFDFSTLWKYVGICNQVLTSITLWAGSVYLVRQGKPHWMLSLPAAFLTAVCIAYFMVSSHKAGGLNLDHTVGWISGTVVALGILGFFLGRRKKIIANRQNHETRMRTNAKEDVVAKGSIRPNEKNTTYE